MIQAGLFLALSLTLLLTQADGFLWNPSEDDSREEDALFSLLDIAADHLGDIIVKTVNDLPLDEDQQDWIIEEIYSAMDLTNTTSEGCVNCVATTALLKTTFALGVTFEDVRETVIEICMNLTAEMEGWDPNIVCVGAIDSFGPHVAYIFNTTEMTSEEICLLVNSCQPDHIEPEPPSSKPIHRRLVGPKPQRAKVDLQNSIKVVHFTDSHIEPRYTTGSATVCGAPFCCRSEFEGSGYALPWGDYDCNVPLKTQSVFLQYFAAMEPQYAMYTGDSPPNSVWEETQEWQISMSRLVANDVKENLPGVPTYQTFGNHETYPVNLYYVPRPQIQELNYELGMIWRDVGNLTQEQLDTINQGGFYTIVIRPGLRVLSYNSNLQATSNWYIILDQENNGYAIMRQFMEDTFDTARANGEKVILLTHHVSGGSGHVRAYSEFVTDICRRNGDIIVLYLSGHSHTDRFAMNTDPDTGEVFAVQLSAPSVNSQTDINPSARMFYLDPVTFDALDMDTFYIDLQDPANNGSEAHIQLSYRATEEYAMADFTPESVKDFVDRMEFDDELLAKYRRNHETKTGFEDPCDEGCKQGLLCGLRSTSYTQKQKCESRNRNRNPLF